jgi:hypothetical protein
MQGGTAWSKVCLGIITPLNETHEFTHCISMKPGRSQRAVIGRHDLRWKNDKVRERCKCWGLNGHG